MLKESDTAKSGEHIPRSAPFKAKTREVRAHGSAGWNYSSGVRIQYARGCKSLTFTSVYAVYTSVYNNGGL